MTIVPRRGTRDERSGGAGSESQQLAECREQGVERPGDRVAWSLRRGLLPEEQMGASELFVDQRSPPPQVGPEHLGAIDADGQARVEAHDQVLFDPRGAR